MVANNGNHMSTDHNFTRCRHGLHGRNMLYLKAPGALDGPDPQTMLLVLGRRRPGPGRQVTKALALYESATASAGRGPAPATGLLLTARTWPTPPLQQRPREALTVTGKSAPAVVYIDQAAGSSSAADVAGSTATTDQHRSVGFDGPALGRGVVRWTPSRPGPDRGRRQRHGPQLGCGRHRRRSPRSACPSSAAASPSPTAPRFPGSRRQTTCRCCRVRDYVLYHASAEAASTATVGRGGPRQAPLLDTQNRSTTTWVRVISAGWPALAAATSSARARSRCVRDRRAAGGGTGRPAPAPGVAAALPGDRGNRTPCPAPTAARDPPLVHRGDPGSRRAGRRGGSRTPAAERAERRETATPARLRGTRSPCARPVSQARPRSLALLHAGGCSRCPPRASSNDRFRFA